MRVDGEGGQVCRCRARSAWSPTPLGGRPALQLCPTFDAAFPGRGCWWWKRSAVAPPSVLATRAKGNSTARGPSGRQRHAMRNVTSAGYNVASPGRGMEECRAAASGGSGGPANGPGLPWLLLTTIFMCGHAGATLGAGFLSVGKSKRPCVHGPEEALGRARRARPDGRGGKSVRGHKEAIGCRTALEALIVRGRRHRGSNRRGGRRMLLLGTPSPWGVMWKPWTAGKRSDPAPPPSGDGVADTDGAAAPCGGDSNLLGQCPRGAAAARDRVGGRFHCGRHRRGGGTRARLGPFRGRAALVTAAGIAALVRASSATSVADGSAGAVRPPVVARLVNLGGGPPICYPQPHRDGFRDVSSPGFEEGERDTAEVSEVDDQFALVAETVNATGWGPLQRRLRTTRAHLVLAQETWILQGQLCAATDWARNNGWEAVMAPARVGEGGGASGGVAVFARKGMGLRYPTDGSHIVEDSRVVAAFCEPPGHRPFLAISAYFIDGQGIKEPNVAIMRKISQAVARHGPSCMALVGADFQCPPSEVDASGFPASLGGRVFASGSLRGTYRSGGSASHLDFFVASGGLAEVVDSVDLVEASGIKGHVPVQLAFRPRAVALRTLAVRQPPPLGMERVYGPLPAPPNWSAASKAADAALATARRGGDRDTIQKAIDKAYREWCVAAEEEIASATGEDPKKWGLRGRRPNLKWSSTLPEASCKGDASPAAIASWLKGAVSELRRIVNTLDDNAASGWFVDEPKQRSYMPHSGTYAAPVRGGYDGPPGGRGARGRGGRPRPAVDLEACRSIVEDIRADLGCEDGRVTDEADLVELWGRAVDIGTRVNAAVAASLKWAHHGDVALAKEAEALGADLAKTEKYWEDRRAADGRRSWRQWLEEDWGHGARHAHAYTKAPTGWIPTTATTARGVLSAAPAAILDGMRTKYAGYWCADEVPVAYEWTGHCDELPPLTPAQLRDASLSFARRTAVTYDGFHVRQFALVGDEGLSVLSVVLAAVEAVGVWPSQTALVTMPLIGKARGGYRGIGKMAALYRVWSKARRPEADKWEAAHDRPFFAAAAGAGPVDAVHRQSMRQEASAAAGGAAAIILEDLEAFYEGIDRQRLLQEAQRHGFPVPIVRACLAAYAAPRMLTLDRIVARELYPRRGVIAGCSFATTFVKLFYLDTFDKLSKGLPSGTNLDVFIDDIAITAEGPKRQVAANITEAHAAMRRAVTQDLGCTLAAQKAAIVASHREVGQEVAARLRQQQALADFAPNLGMDTTAGKRRGCLKASSKRHARLRSGLLRGKRLAAVARTVGRKALRIFTSGIGPGMNYGAEIWGVTDAEATRLRKVAAAAIRPNSKCRSLTIAHLVSGMPTAREEAKAALQYSKAIWRAATRREYAAARGVGLSDLRQQWEAAHADIARHVDDYIASSANNGGRASPKVARRAWAAVRGPVGAAAMSLARLGWRMTSAFTWVNARGDEIGLTTTSPALITIMLVDATKDVAEKRIGAKWSDGDAAFKDRRICPDFAVRAIATRGGGRLTALQTAAFSAAACDGVYTRHRAVANGYDVADVCCHCGAEGDTVHHRVYCCPFTRSAVLAVVPEWLYREGGRASPSSRFWTTGLCPHPADNWPLPAEGFHGLVVGDLNGSEGLVGWEDARTGFGGYLYTDGSCEHGAVRGLSRAGCSAVQTGADGSRTRAIYLPVPRHLPQSSQAGEYVGVAVARRKAARAADVKCDCANVVKAAQAPAKIALAPTKAYAGLVLDRYTRCDEASSNTTVTWVKAHRTECEGDDAATRRDIRGNAAADALAGEAVGLHPQPTAEQKAELEFCTRRAPLIARAIGAALALFPVAETERMVRRPRARCEDEARGLKQHHWVFELGRWRCTLCGTWSSGDCLTRRLEAGRCHGHIADEGACKWTALGHKVAKASGPAPFAFCRRCGAWGSRRSRLLARPCGAPTPAGVLALRRIDAGKHPGQCRLIGGGLAPRARVKVVAAFDGTAKNWRELNVHSGGDVKRRMGRDSRPVSRGGASATCSVLDEASCGATAPSGGPDLADAEFEEDPFGHGGSLSQDCGHDDGVEGGGQRPQQQRAPQLRPHPLAHGVVDGSEGIPSTSVGHGPPAAEAARIETEVREAGAGVAQLPSDASSRKRGLAPSDRMEALRDRVRRRASDCGANVGHGYLVIAGTSSGTRPPTGSGGGTDGIAPTGIATDGPPLGGPTALPEAPWRAPSPAAGLPRLADTPGAGQLRSEYRLWAGSPTKSHRDHLRHHHLGGEGRRSPGEPGDISQALRGRHAVHQHHDNRGAGSRCSRDPTTVPPPCPTDEGRGGLVSLAGVAPPSTTTWGLQEHPRHVDAAHNVVPRARDGQDVARDGDADGGAAARPRASGDRRGGGDIEDVGMDECIFGDADMRGDDTVGGCTNAGDTRSIAAVHPGSDVAPEACVYPSGTEQKGGNHSGPRSGAQFGSDHERDGRARRGDDDLREHRGPAPPPPPHHHLHRASHQLRPSPPARGPAGAIAPGGEPAAGGGAAPRSRDELIRQLRGGSDDRRSGEARESHRGVLDQAGQRDPDGDGGNAHRRGGGEHREAAGEKGRPARASPSRPPPKRPRPVDRGGECEDQGGDGDRYLRRGAHGRFDDDDQGAHRRQSSTEHGSRGPREADEGANGRRRRPSARPIAGAQREDSDHRRRGDDGRLNDDSREAQRLQNAAHGGREARDGGRQDGAGVPHRRRVEGRRPLEGCRGTHGHQHYLRDQHGGRQHDPRHDVVNRRLDEGAEMPPRPRSGDLGTDAQGGTAMSRGDLIRLLRGLPGRAPESQARGERRGEDHHQPRESDNMAVEVHGKLRKRDCSHLRRGESREEGSASEATRRTGGDGDIIHAAGTRPMENADGLGFANHGSHHRPELVRAQLPRRGDGAGEVGLGEGEDDGDVGGPFHDQRPGGPGRVEGEAAEPRGHADQSVWRLRGHGPADDQQRVSGVDAEVTNLHLSGEGAAWGKTKAAIGLSNVQVRSEPLDTFQFSGNMFVEGRARPQRIVGDAQAPPPAAGEVGRGAFHGGLQGELAADRSLRFREVVTHETNLHAARGSTSPPLTSSTCQRGSMPRLADQPIGALPAGGRAMRVIDGDSVYRHSPSHQYGKHDSRGSSSAHSRAPGTVQSDEWVSR